MSSVIKRRQTTAEESIYLHSFPMNKVMVTSVNDMKLDSNSTNIQMPKCL